MSEAFEPGLRLCPCCGERELPHGSSGRWCSWCYDECTASDGYCTKAVLNRSFGSPAHDPRTASRVCRAGGRAH